MELTARRTAAIALAGFALLVLARPPRPTGMTYDEVSARTRTPVDDARRGLTNARDSLRVVEYSLWSGQLRDSLRRDLRRLPQNGRDRLFLDPRVPASLRGHLERVYAATRAGLPKGEVALPLFVVVDTAQSYRLGTMLWIEPSEALPGACATVIRARVTRQALADERLMARELRRSLPTNFPQARHFGLCGFEAAFGLPSPAMRRWLHERDYRPVASGYDVAAVPRTPRRIMDNAVPYFNGTNNAALALDLRSCLAGRVEHCLDAVAPPTSRPLGVLDDAASDWRWYGWGWGGSPELVNAIAQSIGAARFRELWQSDEAPPTAYQRITGAPVDTLARRVLAGTAPSIRAGARPSMGEALLSLLIAGLLAGAAMLAQPRRRT